MQVFSVFFSCVHVLVFWFFCVINNLNVVFCARYYVDINSTSLNPDGSSWSSAFSTIEDALNVFNNDGSSSNELWISGGHYYASSNKSRDSCYSFKSRIQMLGGFIGTENNIDDREYPLSDTIIDGDIGIIGDVKDNCYHIIQLNDSSRGSYFNGIIFENGYAVYDNADGSNYEAFGGVLTTHINDNMRIVFDNCTFRNNTAYQGGVLHINKGSSVEFNYCIFQNNKALKNTYLGGYGGCIFSTWAAEVNITHSQFMYVFVVCFCCFFFFNVRSHQ